MGITRNGKIRCGENWVGEHQGSDVQKYTAITNKMVWAYGKNGSGKINEKDMVSKGLHKRPRKIWNHMVMISLKRYWLT